MFEYVPSFTLFIGDSVRHQYIVRGQPIQETSVPETLSGTQASMMVSFHLRLPFIQTLAIYSAYFVLNHSLIRLPLSTVEFLNMEDRDPATTLKADFLIGSKG